MSESTNSTNSTNQPNFESLRMKARKLAALAARGVGGEREAAAQKLQAFLARHGLTLESLEAGERRWCELECVVDPTRPTKDNDLARLAVQCLVYVMQCDVPREAALRPRMIETSKGRRRKAQFWVMRAQLTPPEFEDWVACFGCHAPAFVKCRQRLRLALKRALSGFIHSHGIFPPPNADDKAKPLSAAELQALLDVMRSSEGKKWERPAGRLQQEGFLLR